MFHAKSIITVDVMDIWIIWQGKFPDKQYICSRCQEMRWDIIKNNPNGWQRSPIMKRWRILLNKMVWLICQAQPLPSNLSKMSQFNLPILLVNGRHDCCQIRNILQCGIRKKHAKKLTSFRFLINNHYTIPKGLMLICNASRA